MLIFTFSYKWNEKYRGFKRDGIWYSFPRRHSILFAMSPDLLDQLDDALSRIIILRYNNVFYDTVYSRRNEAVSRPRKEFIPRSTSRVSATSNHMYDTADSYNFNNSPPTSK